jgi:hypothetical protein
MAGVTTGVKIFVRHLGETLVLPTPADGSVTAAKLGTNSVDGTKIAMGSDAQGDILYHGASDYARLAKGTASQVLKMNAGATAPEWGAAGGGGLASQQVFTADGTWTRPSGITQVKVFVTGAGAGGGSGGANYNGGGAGGAGGTAIEIIDVSSISSVTVTIGAGGAGGAASSTGDDGVSGGTSSFGSYTTATGGFFGSGANITAIAADSTGGLGAGGDINLYGGDGGSAGGGAQSDDPSAHTGGSSFWGGGGSGGTLHAAAEESHAGRVFGSGGGGGKHPSGDSAAGGAGADGIVIVEEYIA